MKTNEELEALFRPLPVEFDPVASALEQAECASGRTVSESPRKVSDPTPNVANDCARWAAENWPELAGHDGVWLTGSTIWRYLYGGQPPVDADLDVFCTSWAAYRRVRAFFETQRTKPSAERAQMTRSRGLDGEGERIHTARGWVDLWFDPEATDPVLMLRSFPSDGYAHCRAAFCPASGALLVLPNEAAE